jgi:hypothetical protein
MLRDVFLVVQDEEEQNKLPLKGKSGSKLPHSRYSFLQRQLYQKIE